jgi:hypothetical protein
MTVLLVCLGGVIISASNDLGAIISAAQRGWCNN